MFLACAASNVPSHFFFHGVHMGEQQVEHDAIKREKRRANLQLEEERGQRRKKRIFSSDLDTYVVRIRSVGFDCA